MSDVLALSLRASPTQSRPGFLVYTVCATRARRGRRAAEKFFKLLQDVDNLHAEDARHLLLFLLRLVMIDNARSSKASSLPPYRCHIPTPQIVRKISKVRARFQTRQDLLKKLVNGCWDTGPRATRRSSPKNTRTWYDVHTLTWYDVHTLTCEHLSAVPKQPPPPPKTPFPGTRKPAVKVAGLEDRAPFECLMCWS